MTAVMASSVVMLVVEVAVVNQMGRTIPSFRIALEMEERKGNESVEVFKWIGS
jgi:hypothetical protein